MNSFPNPRPTIATLSFSPGMNNLLGLRRRPEHHANRFGEGFALKDSSPVRLDNLFRPPLDSSLTRVGEGGLLVTEDDGHGDLGVAGHEGLRRLAGNAMFDGSI